MTDTEAEKHPRLCPALLMAQLISGKSSMVTDCRQEQCACWDEAADACAVLAIAQAIRADTDIAHPSRKLVEIIAQVWDDMKRKES